MPSWSPPLRALLPALVLALGLTGCAAFRNYDRELTGTLNYALSGNVEGAIKTLDSNNPVNDRDLLYYLELGMLQRLGNRYPESQKTWTAGNTRIQLRYPHPERPKDLDGAQPPHPAARPAPGGGEPGAQRLELPAERQAAHVRWLR